MAEEKRQKKEKQCAKVWTRGRENEERYLVEHIKNEGEPSEML